LKKCDPSHELTEACPTAVVSRMRPVDRDENRRQWLRCESHNVRDTQFKLNA
jgi:hypothetical protein